MTPWDVAKLNEQSAGHLPELVGFEVTEAEPGRVCAQIELREELMAPNGYLHAATVIALADTACGYGVRVDMPEEARGFTTIELKANFLRTAREGTIECEALRPHDGRTTQVWDARVGIAGTGKPIALFRCTQLILR